MSARGSPTSSGQSDSQVVTVDYGLPLKDILRAHKVDTYSGGVHEQDKFPSNPSLGTTRYRWTLLTFTKSMRIVEAIKFASRQNGYAFADLWTLATCAHLLGEQSGKKIYSFVPQVHTAKDKVIEYPVIGRNGNCNYIGLTRNDFSVDPGEAVLLVTKVLVRG